MGWLKKASKWVGKNAQSIVGAASFATSLLPAGGLLSKGLDMVKKTMGKVAEKKKQDDAVQKAFDNKNANVNYINPNEGGGKSPEPITKKNNMLYIVGGVLAAVIVGVFGFMFATKKR